MAQISAALGRHPGADTRPQPAWNMTLVIDIFENGSPKPVLGHVFYGQTNAEINSIVAAHMKTDSFFKAAMTTGRFQGILLTTQQRWMP